MILTGQISPLFLTELVRSLPGFSSSRAALSDPSREFTAFMPAIHPLDAESNPLRVLVTGYGVRIGTGAPSKQFQLKNIFYSAILHVRRQPLMASGGTVG